MKIVLAPSTVKKPVYTSTGSNWVPAVKTGTTSK